MRAKSRRPKIEMAGLLSFLVPDAGQLDFQAELARLTGEEAHIYDLPRLLRDRRVDGFLASGYLTAELTQLFDQLELPYVVLGSYGEPVVRHCLCVQADIEAALAELVEALLRSGRERIAYFTEEDGLYSSRRALAAFEMAVREAGLPYRPELVFIGEGPYCGAVKYLAASFQESPLPFDGIVVYDYRNAVEVSHMIAAGEDLGSGRPRAVPATIRPYPYHRLPIPAIYADGKSDEVARLGAEQLIRCIDRGEPCRPGRIMVKLPITDLGSQRQEAECQESAGK